MLTRHIDIGASVSYAADLSGEFDETLFSGSFSYQRPIESTGGTNIFNGKRTGCFTGSTNAQDGIFYVYHVLIAR